MSTSDAAARNVDGIVVTAFGSGNVSADVACEIELLVKVGIPVVIATDIAGGTCLTDAYQGGGKYLEDMGAILAGCLPPQKARIALMLCLVSNINVRAFFADKFSD